MIGELSEFNFIKICKILKSLPRKINMDSPNTGQELITHQTYQTNTNDSFLNSYPEDFNEIEGLKVKEQKLEETLM